MPSASTAKLEKQASSEAPEPIKNVFTVIEHKIRNLIKKKEQAASTQVYCATAPELSDVSGLYFNNCYRCPPSDTAQDPELSARLWDISVEIIGSHFSTLDIPDRYRNRR